MRIGMIPEGTKVVELINDSGEDVVIWASRRIFVFMPRNTFQIIDARSFVVGFPADHFPKTVLYCKKKILVRCR